MPKEFGSSDTFNVIYLTPCDAEEDDAYTEKENPTLQGHIPRGRLRRIKEEGSLKRKSKFVAKASLVLGYIASQCPNRRAMIVRDDGKVASDSSHRETSISSESESRTNDSCVEGDLLVVKRLIGS
ncbi:hypothetical protein CR513_14532, partial [Mucuna pruriens]